MQKVDQIKEFIVREFSAEGNEIKEDTPLLESGIIDSTGILELIFFIEKTYRIKIPDEKIIPENFESINALGNLIASIA